MDIILNSRIKLVSVVKDKTNKLCRINVLPATNSMYWWVNFNNLSNTGKLICGHSYIPVLSALVSVAQNLHCLLQICSGVLIAGM